MKNLNETLYTNKDITGKNVVIDGKDRIVDIGFLDMMRETGHIETNVEALEGAVEEVSVVWYMDGDDLVIDQIYNNDTGEVYFEDHDENWTDEDETLINSILMWVDVQSTLGEMYG